MSRRNRQESANNEIYSAEQVRRVLQSCGIDIQYEVESDFMIYCPYHNNFRTAAAEISKESGQFFCFGCQESVTLVEFVMFTTKRSYFESVRLIASKAASINIIDDINSMLTKPQSDFIEFDSSLINRLHQSALASDRAMRYFNGRGISERSVEQYLLGYSDKQDMVTVPITSPDGMFVGFVARSIEGKQFKNSVGLPRNKTMFNLSKAKRFNKVFVVESSFDAIRIEQVGGHAVAALGATVNRQQKELLKKYFTSIIVVSDNDEAGQGMADRLQEYFSNTLVIGRLPSSVKDVSDMNDEELSKFVSMFEDEISYILQ